MARYGYGEVQYDNQPAIQRALRTPYEPRLEIWAEIGGGWGRSQARSGRMGEIGNLPKILMRFAPRSIGCRSALKSCAGCRVDGRTQATAHGRSCKISGQELYTTVSV